MLTACIISTQAIECLYRMLKYRGYITPIPYGEVTKLTQAMCIVAMQLFNLTLTQVMLFSAASAVLLPAYRSFTLSYVCTKTSDTHAFNHS